VQEPAVGVACGELARIDKRKSHDIPGGPSTLQILGGYVRIPQHGGGTLTAPVPFGIAFGAAHALTTGHSKTVLFLFVTESGASLSRGIGIAAILSATHIAISALVVVLSLPVVSLAFGEVGRAPVLEDLSRDLIGLVGLWLLVTAIRGHAAHSHHEGAAFGVVAGLIPCPLTLFVMTVASARGVPEAGLPFAFMMLSGVAAVLASVAALLVAARAGLGYALGMTGAVLMLIANSQLWRS
jgi:ABC-type nickel/cobalt efflux system permease component RcnA